MSDPTAPSSPMETQEDEEESKDVPAAPAPAPAPPPSSAAAASPAMNPPASSSSTKKPSQKRALDNPVGYEADPDAGNMNKKRKDDDVALLSFASSLSNLTDELALLEKMVSFHRTFHVLPSFSKASCTEFSGNYLRLNTHPDEVVDMVQSMRTRYEIRKTYIKFVKDLDRQALEMAHELFGTGDVDEQAASHYYVEEPDDEDELSVSQEKKKENVGAESADVEKTEVSMEEKDQKDEASSEDQDSMSM